MKIRLRVDESVQEGIQRIARTYLQRSIDDLSDPQLDRAEVVHDVRKRCKMIRGMLRMVRPGIGDVYDRENAWFRDASRKLSGLRDADATLEAFDLLRQHGAQSLPRKFMDRVNKVLSKRSEVASTGPLDWQPFFVEAIQDMQAALDRVPQWTCADEGFAAIGPGFAKTYRRGARAMLAARKQPTDEHLHDWRKHAKYQWYQVLMLRDLSKSKLSIRAKQLKRLTDLLGDDHDLVVLHQLLAQHPDFEKLRGANAFEKLMRSIDRRRAKLQKQARKLGKRLFATSSKKFTNRLEQAWEAWRSVEPVG
ncbi:CHAD domain protein [Rosistilla ulvae]|uniref:CHAD domain protein n=1 Tax=Rosistilla ulvae TaxID=1930277 RepID=A0A517M414_9BACT|nr:CHAD domain-containing protein [Rosistilla ulvae]QDS89607.1 CHAD domain protein [Rosistilla ulvae]